MHTIPHQTGALQAELDPQCLPWPPFVLNGRIATDPKEIVIDTSALLAVLAHAPERPALIRVMNEAALLAPPSVHWEIGHALAAMVGRQAATLDQVHHALEAYQRLGIRFVDVPLRQAIELSEHLHVSASDAYVITCAQNQRAALLSLNRELIEQARRVGVKTLEVEGL